jgi:hypothetical protein
MPVTLPGWILFAVMLASNCVASFMSGTLLFTGFGKREPKSLRYMVTALAFGAVMIASALLFIWVEPRPA